MGRRECGFQCQSWGAPGLRSQPAAIYYRAGALEALTGVQGRLTYGIASYSIILF